MSPPPRRRRKVPYWVSFALLTLLLGGGMAAFVLGVLPRRFVLQRGLRESGQGFPSSVPAFGPAARAPLVRPAHARPAPAAPEPGPAQAFWDRALPLLRAGRYGEALPLFRDYLRDHPGDDDVRREYATTLRKAGRQEEAGQVLERLAGDTGKFYDRLALARWLRDRGETGRAEALYRRLVSERPADADLRLELAQALLWAGRPADARAALAALPDSVRGGEQAGKLAAEIAAQLPAPPESAAAGAAGPEAGGGKVAAGQAAEKAPPSLLERARSAAAHDSLRLASSLYARAVEEEPGDATAWQEWADLLELRLRDYAGAASALERWLALTGRDGDAHLRLARLESWAGRQDRARAILDSLVERRPESADAWAWLGDLRRFGGDRPGAADAYGRALALEPGQARATSGMAALEALDDQILSEREPREVGPDASLFHDTDHFRRIDASMFGRARSGALVLEGRAGYRRLDGNTVFGPPIQPARTGVNGVFADATVARWWRQATIRTSLTLGAERLGGMDVRPHFGAGLQLPDAGGFALSAGFRHAPAYPLTRTLESVLEPVTADQLSLSLYRGLGDAWSLQAGLDAALLTAAALPDNVRVVGSVALRRKVSSWLTAGYVTRWAGFTRSARLSGGTTLGGVPISQPASPQTSPTGPRLYWDPKSFWSHQLLLEAATPAGDGGWGAHLGLRPGFALLDERGLPSTTVPQFEVDAGLDNTGPWGSFTAGLFYGRAREGGYESFGAQVGARVRIP